MGKRAEFTPGPWTKHDHTVDGHWPVSADHGDGRACIARVGFDDDLSRDEAAANAHLIAHAPDLLAELVRICKAAETAAELVKKSHPRWSDSLTGIICSSRVAIAKAEGRVPSADPRPDVRQALQDEPREGE